MKKIVLATIVCVFAFCGCDKPQKNQVEQSKVEAYCEDFIFGEVQDLLTDQCVAVGPNVLTCDLDEIRRYEMDMQKAEQKMRSLCEQFVRGADGLHCDTNEKFLIDYIAAKYIRVAKQWSKRAANMVALVDFVSKNRARMNTIKWDGWCEWTAPLFDNLTLQLEFDDMLELCGIGPDSENL